MSVSVSLVLMKRTKVDILLYEEQEVRSRELGEEKGGEREGGERGRSSLIA